MKRLLLIVIASAALLTMIPDTVEARWNFGFGVYYDNCNCYWGEPSPWDAWWDCSCYWDVWEWCAVHPYWMWPRWCRVYVQSYYSPCGRYYYVYYDHHVPRSRRVYVDGRYRYRYEVPLGSTYSITERIPRRSGLERPAGAGQPMPETVSRTLASLGPDYRVKTVAAHAEPASIRNTDRPTSNNTPSRERPSTDGAITPTNTTIPVRGVDEVSTRKTTELSTRETHSIPVSTNSETGAVTIERKTTVESAVKTETSIKRVSEETKKTAVSPKAVSEKPSTKEPEKKEAVESREARPEATRAVESRSTTGSSKTVTSSRTSTSSPQGGSSKSIRNK